MVSDTSLNFIYSSISSVIIIAIGLIILNFMAYRLKISHIRIFILSLWHYCFVFIAFFYSINFVSDSSSYFEEAVLGQVLLDQTLAVRIIVFLNVILNQYLGLNYLGTYLFYGYLGLLGILLLDSSLNYYFKKKDRESFIIKNFIILMPSLHFWSSNIGKDTIAIFAMCLFIWLLTYRKNILFCFIPLAIFSLVRPHHSVILLFSIFFTLTIFLRARYMFPLIIMISIFSFLNLEFIINLSGIGLQINKNILFFLDPNFYSALDYHIIIRQNLPDYDGSGFINLTNMLFPSHIFTYLFRPLPFEAKSIFTLVASIENLFFIIFFIYTFFNFKTFKIFDKKHYLYLFFFIFALIPLSFLTPNFGISARQKWIILIPIILVCCKILQTKKFKKNY